MNAQKKNALAKLAKYSTTTVLLGLGQKDYSNLTAMQAASQNASPARLSLALEKTELLLVFSIKPLAMYQLPAHH